MEAFHPFHPGGDTAGVAAQQSGTWIAAIGEGFGLGVGLVSHLGGAAAAGSGYLSRSAGQLCSASLQLLGLGLLPESDRLVCRLSPKLSHVPLSVYPIQP